MTEEPQGTTNGRFDDGDGPRIVGPNDGKAIDLGTLGARFMVWASDTGGQVSLVDHPIPPRTLAAPLHRHSREDEFHFVLESRMGTQGGFAGAAPA